MLLRNRIRIPALHIPLNESYNTILIHTNSSILADIQLIQSLAMHKRANENRLQRRRHDVLGSPIVVERILALEIRRSDLPSTMTELVVSTDGIE